MTASLYLPLGGGRYLATEHTQGPWDPGHQHGGAPAALLAGALELDHPRPDLSLVRFTLDILAPMPVGPVEVCSRVVREGRRVQLLAAEMAAGGRPVAAARGWRVRLAEHDGIATDTPPAPAAIPDPEAGAAPFGGFGYYHALDWRFASGGFAQHGPATAWLRLRLPVLPDLEPTPMQRVVAVADSASGVSNALPFETWVFTNVDLAVHLHRRLAGEWVCLDAATTLGEEGSGVCRTTLYDERGDLGSAAQTLYVAERAK